MQTTCSLMNKWNVENIYHKKCHYSLFSKKVKLLTFYRAHVCFKNVQRPVQFCVKTCHDEYSDKLILHSKSTVNCQQRVEMHLCITHQIKENGQLIHAFQCVHLIPIIDTHFKTYLNNQNKDMRFAINS